MRAKLIFLLFIGFCLTEPVLADVPNADNWESFDPEICAADPEHPLGLRAVIFPPQFETYLETLLETSTIDMTIQRDQNGKYEFQARELPDMRHPKTRRRLSGLQYLAFLNPEGELVREGGMPFTNYRPLTPRSTSILRGEDGSDIIPQPTLEEYTLKHDKPYQDVMRDEIEVEKRKLEKADTCTFIYYSFFEKRLVRTRQMQPYGQFQCRDGGGYELSSPLITQSYDYRRVVGATDSGNFIYKDANGDISVQRTLYAPHFYESDHPTLNACEWTQIH